jgi:CheY-like chemotaxis protein
VNSLDESVHLGGRKILIIDDDVDVLHLLKIILSNVGAQVTIHATANGALAAIDSMKPDIVISDLDMPSVDGYAFVRSLRSRSPKDGGVIPAIALTAHNDNKHRRMALEAGFTEHIAKPLRAIKLIEAIRRVLAVPLTTVEREA